MRGSVVSRDDIDGRNGDWYGKWMKIYNWLGSEDRTTEEIVRRIYSILDGKHAFGSYSNSKAANVALDAAMNDCGMIKEAGGREKYLVELAQCSTTISNMGKNLKKISEGDIGSEDLLDDIFNSVYMSMCQGRDINKIEKALNCLRELDADQEKIDKVRDKLADVSAEEIAGD